MSFIQLNFCGLPKDKRLLGGRRKLCIRNSFYSLFEHANDFDADADDGGCIK
jgi:hypothetical protein